jgi:hypothetical protein
MDSIYASIWCIDLVQRSGAAILFMAIVYGSIAGVYAFESPVFEIETTIW